MKAYSVVLTDETHKQLFDHLIRVDGDEDLCFATYKPSTGSKRFTGILSQVILPKKGERKVHGNVGFMPRYFERALGIAEKRGEGLVFLHSHPSSGWQSMSKDDEIAETRMSPTAYAVTGLPLLGLTLGTDGSWSARFWLKDRSVRRKYDRQWCESVRVLGKSLKVTFNDNILKPHFDSKKQLRTISAWGLQSQEDLSRLRIGIVGLGSVGSIVAEILARTGFSNFTLIDFDSVEEKNLDRLTNVFKSDIGRAKVLAVKKGIVRSATSPKLTIECCEYSICEKEGYETALNCDILFSCVDRPWGRQVLNVASYAHYIPVIDGGIMVRTNRKNTRMIGADWRAQTVGYKRCCLECLGQFKMEYAALEKTGLLDDPAYIKGLPDTTFVNAHENVFVFSSHLASLEVLQLLSMFLSPSGFADVGQQMHHFVTGEMDLDKEKKCDSNCFFQTIAGQGDTLDIEPYGSHSVAACERQKRLKGITSMRP